MQEPAIGLVPTIFKDADIGQVCTLLPKLPEASQVQMLAALSGYPKDAVQSTFLTAANTLLARGRARRILDQAQARCQASAIRSTLHRDGQRLGEGAGGGAAARG